MDYGLRMDHDIDLVRSRIEQPPGLNHLESLVHHRGGINGDFRSHCPLRMLQRLILRGSSDPVPVPGTERPAGCSEMDARNRIASRPEKALEYGRMFRIHRQNRRIVLLGQVHDHRPAGHQSLLVRKSDYLARLYRGNRRPEPAEPDKRSKDNVNVFRLHERADRIHARKHLYIIRLQSIRNFLVFGFITYDYASRAEFHRLFYQKSRTVVCRKQFNLEQILVLSYYIQSLTADGTGRAQNRYATFFCH